MSMTRAKNAFDASMRARFKTADELHAAWIEFATEFVRIAAGVNFTVPISVRDSELDQRQGELFAQHAGAGKSIREIAILTSVPRSTVHRRLMSQRVG
jgi:DNA-directed RNA polymerase specialized sigma24 family protein